MIDFSGAVWRKSSRSGGNGGDCVEVATVWRKSSRSGGNGGNCVEVATTWRKTSRSGSNGGACVEVATDDPRVVAVRDSTDPTGPVLTVPPAAWRAFLASLHR